MFTCPVCGILYITTSTTETPSIVKCMNCGKALFQFLRERGGSMRVTVSYEMALKPVPSYTPVIPTDHLQKLS